MTIHSSNVTAAKQPLAKPFQPIDLTELPEMLQDRGISDAAIAAGWRSFTVNKRSGWYYQVFDTLTEQPYRDPVTQAIVYRWKNADETTQGGPQYIWLKGQNAYPSYYVLPGTQSAIALANGVCYLADRELDVLAYISAGIHNVITRLNGDGSPENLAQIAQQIGITEFRSLVKHDATAEQLAHATAIALEDIGIGFAAYRLPDEVGDIINLWIMCQFDASLFIIELHRIQADPQAIIHQPVSSDVLRANSEKKTTVDWDAEYAEWVRNEVMSRLDQCDPVISHDGSVEQRLCPSPDHIEEIEYLRISYDQDSDLSILECSCKIQYEYRPWDKLGEWVGAPLFIEWFNERQFKKQVRRSGSLPEPFSDQTLSLPNSQTLQPRQRAMIGSHLF